MKVAGNNLFQLTGVLLAGNDSNQFLIFVSFFGNEYDIWNLLSKEEMD